MPGPRPKLSGIPPGMVRYQCCDCGRVRWYHPSTVQHMAQPYRCAGCARKHRFALSGKTPAGFCGKPDD